MFKVLLSENGGRTPKRVAGKTVYVLHVQIAGFNTKKHIILHEMKNMKNSVHTYLKSM